MISLRNSSIGTSKLYLSWPIADDTCRKTCISWSSDKILTVKDRLRGRLLGDKAQVSGICDAQMDNDKIEMNELSPNL